MTSLLTVPFAIVLTALVGLLLLALVVATVLLLLLALLALDLLLERYGVDRRARVRQGWDRLRRSGTPANRPAQGRAASSSEPRDERGAPAASAQRIPFSARRPARPARSTNTPETRPTEPASAPAEDVAPSETVAAEPATVPTEPMRPTAIAAEEAPAPAAEAVTEVLAVETPDAPRTRGPRASRVVPRRTPSPEPAPAPTPPPAHPVEPGPAADPAPADRDSAIDRLFAPLLESDRTEPLPTPRAARPARRPRDED